MGDHTASDRLCVALDEVHFGKNYPLDDYKVHDSIWTVELDQTKHSRIVPGAFEVTKYSKYSIPDLREWCEISRSPSGSHSEHGRAKIVLVLAESGDALHDGSNLHKNMIKALFTSLGLPLATVSFYLDRAAQFASFPAPSRLSSKGQKIYLLSMRWWTACWRYDPLAKTSAAIVLVEGTHVGSVEDQLVRKLEQLQEFVDQPCFIGLVISLLERTQLAGWVHHNEMNSNDTDYQLMDYMNQEMGPDPTADSLDINNRAFWITMHSNRLKNLELLLSALNKQNVIFREHIDSSAASYQESLLLDDAFEHMSQSIQADIMLCTAINERATMQLATLTNIVAQRDTNLSIQIAASSRELAAESKEDQKLSIAIANASRSIAADAKRDSASMKTIAAVTMVFLPGTFVATVFAMPVFSLGEGTTSFSIAPQIWIYWAVTAPLTFLTIFAWLLWQMLQDKSFKWDALDSWLNSNGSKEKEA